MYILCVRVIRIKINVQRSGCLFFKHLKFNPLYLEIITTVRPKPMRSHLSMLDDTTGENFVCTFWIPFLPNQDSNITFPKHIASQKLTLPVRPWKLVLGRGSGFLLGLVGLFSMLLSGEGKCHVGSNSFSFLGSNRKIHLKKIPPNHSTPHQSAPIENNAFHLGHFFFGLKKFPVSESSSPVKLMALRGASLQTKHILTSECCWMKSSQKKVEIRGKWTIGRKKKSKRERRIEREKTLPTIFT